MATLASFGLAFAAVLLLVVFAVPVGTMAAKLEADLRGRGNVVTMDMPDGRTWSFVIRLESGYESQAQVIACTVVKPDLEGTPFAGARFELTSRDGRILATDETPCGS